MQTNTSRMHGATRRPQAIFSGDQSFVLNMQGTDHRDPVSRETSLRMVVCSLTMT